MDRLAGALSLGEGGCEVSFVWVSPELVSAAAADVAGIGSAVGAANTAAAAATTELLAAGGDEVSAAIAELFGMYGRDYQRIAFGAAGFHARVAALLGAGADSYGWAESSGVLSLQGLQRDVWGDGQRSYADVVGATANW